MDLKTIPFKVIFSLPLFEFSFSFYRVALGDFSPRAPTEPYVRALAHTAHQNFVSLP